MLAYLFTMTSSCFSAAGVFTVLWCCLALHLLDNRCHVESLSMNNGSMNQRTWGEATLALSTFSGNLLSLPSSALAQQQEPTTRKKAATTPYLLPEYYNNKAATMPSAGRSFFPTLTPPFFHRATYRYELGRNSWALEQLLTFANVTATIRTNVIQLEGGRLWVHSPQWPTGEYCSLLKELGTVQHAVLPCNALEHKAPMKAFLEAFPDATVWILPGQYGPFGKCGFDLRECNMGYKVDGVFPVDSTSTNKLPPWADEFDIITLYADLPENAGPVSEVAFCHRPTSTLVATDAVVYVPPKVPPLGIFETYFSPDVVASPGFWPKTALQAVFLPLRTNNNENGQSYYYPGFEALQGKLVRAPILRAFCDARAPDEVREWVRRIGRQFQFDRIVTSHFASPIAATPRDFLGAFSYLLENSSESLPNIACQDWELLNGLNRAIEKNKLGAPVIFDFQKGCLEEE